jgi:hypothetical protein
MLVYPFVYATVSSVDRSSSHTCVIPKVNRPSGHIAPTYTHKYKFGIFKYADNCITCDVYIFAIHCAV